jgi:putative membrane protein
VQAVEESAVKVVIRILINAAALWVAVELLDGFNFDYEGEAWVGFLVIALILGVINTVVKPILSLLSLPAVILTLGLFLLVVNAIVLAITVFVSESLGLALSSDGFGWTFLAALIVSLVSWALESFLGKR